MAVIYERNIIWAYGKHFFLFLKRFLISLVIYFMRLLVISIELLSFKSLKKLICLGFNRLSFFCEFFFEMKNEKFTIQNSLLNLFSFFFNHITKWKIGLVTFVTYMVDFQFTKENKSSWDGVYILLITGI